MAAVPWKCVYENAGKYFKNEMTKEERKKWEENLKLNLKIVKKVFK